MFARRIAGQLPAMRVKGPIAVVTRTLSGSGRVTALTVTSSGAAVRQPR
jgi:hypothetical protein